MASANFSPPDPSSNVQRPPPDTHPTPQPSVPSKVGKLDMGRSMSRESADPSSEKDEKHKKTTSFFKSVFGCVADAGSPPPAPLTKKATQKDGQDEQNKASPILKSILRKPQTEVRGESVGQNQGESVSFAPTAKGRLVESGNQNLVGKEFEIPTKSQDGGPKPKEHPKTSFKELAQQDADTINYDNIRDATQEKLKQCTTYPTTSKDIFESGSRLIEDQLNVLLQELNSPPANRKTHSIESIKKELKKRIEKNNVKSVTMDKETFGSTPESFFRGAEKMFRTTSFRLNEYEEGKSQIADGSWKEGEKNFRIPTVPPDTLPLFHQLLDVLFQDQEVVNVIERFLSSNKP